MRRRTFITIIGGMAAGMPLSVRAQMPTTKVFRIGFLGLPSADSLPKRTEAFRAGLRDLGYQEGKDLVIEYRWADSHYERLPALLAELINLNVDVIVTHGTPGVMAAKRATSKIPIVIATVGLNPLQRRSFASDFWACLLPTACLSAPRPFARVCAASVIGRGATSSSNIAGRIADTSGCRRCWRS